MTQDEAVKIGTEVANFLGLNLNKETGRYDTTWGNKTAEGIARCIERIVTEHTESAK